MSMDIYAPAGTRVRFVNTNDGYNHDQEKARKHLVINGIYTVLSTSVHSWHTDVYLKELPEHGFNSVLFEVVEERKPMTDPREIAEFCHQVRQSGELIVHLAEFDCVRQSNLEASRDFPMMKQLVALAGKCLVAFAEGNIEEAMRLRDEALVLIADKNAEIDREEVAG